MTVTRTLEETIDTLKEDNREMDLLQRIARRREDLKRTLQRATRLLAHLEEDK